MSALRLRIGPHLAERLTAGALAIVAAIVLVASFQLGMARGEQPGPGLFPALVSGALLVLALIWLAQGSRMPQSTEGGLAHAIGLDELEAEVEAAAAADAIEAPVEAPSRSRTAVLAFAIAWALVPILLLTMIGFILTMTIYVSGLLLAVGRTSRLWTVPIVLVGAVLVGIGARAIGIYLPEPIPLLAGLGW